MEELDSDIGYLLEKFEDGGLIDNINIIITSDHGLLATHLHFQVVFSLAHDLVEYRPYRVSTGNS